MKLRNFALVLLSLAVAVLTFFKVEGVRREDTGPAGRTLAQNNRYGLYLASFGAEIANDIFALEEIYPEAAISIGRDFLNKSFMLKARGKDIEGSRAAAKANLEQNPANTLAAIYLAYSDFLVQDYAAANGWLTSLGDRSDAFVVKFLRSWALLGMGEKDAALDLLESEINNKAFEKIVLMHLALQAEIAGEDLYAEELYAEVLKFKPDLSDIENIAGFYLRNDLEGMAIKVISDFSRELSSSVSALSLLRAVENGYIPPKIDTPEKGLAKALFDISNVLLRTFSFTDDVYMFYIDMAVGLWPEFTMARLMQAEMYMKHGRTMEYTTALLSIPRESHLYLISRLNYASHLLLGDMDNRRALGIYRSLLREYPSFAAIYQNLGDYYRSSNSPRRALRYYTKGIKSAEGGVPSDLYFSRAIANDMLNNIGAAKDDFERALEIDPKNPVILNYYGYFLVSGGHDIERGRRLVELAVHIDPLNPYYLDSFAWALFKSGDIEGALRIGQYAKAFAPTNPVIMDHLGDIYWMADRMLEARFEWKKALARLKEGAGSAYMLDGLTEQKLEHKIMYGLE